MIVIGLAVVLALSLLSELTSFLAVLYWGVCFFAKSYTAVPLGDVDFLSILVVVAFVGSEAEAGNGILLGAFLYGILA